MEICLDCKDKVVKFYHFKRKVKEVQKQNKNKTANTKKSQQNRKRSKSVHNIVNIVENFMKSHSVSSVRVDESKQRLVIESCAVDQGVDEPYESSSYSSSNKIVSADLKQEPEDWSASDNVEPETSSQLMVELTDIFIKEEFQEAPLDHVENSFPPVIRKKAKTKKLTPNANTLKMRAYRERLKLPENRLKYLSYLEKQRSYMKKKPYQKLKKR